MADLASWAQEARDDQWWQEAEPQKVIDIIESVCEGQLDPDDAAGEIQATYESLILANPKAATVIWAILFRAVASIGRDQDASQRLVDLVLALQKTGEMFNQSGSPVKLNGQVVWSELPEFSYMFRTYCLSISHPDDCDGDWTEEAAPTLVNATTFGALYLNQTSDPKHMSFFASTGLIDGLEKSWPDVEMHRQAPVYLDAATIWINQGGAAIYRLCHDRFPRTAAVGTLEKGCKWLWTGGQGFSPARWDFWKQRLDACAANQDFDLELRAKVEQAKKKMEAIEEEAK
ncbi:hypothetical protein F4808DRAFT_441723 [Astrocystis sublimbata]|nr:hypothetical protein F4808DRAFT_441723 [Astrocystis sublimbata]